MTVHILLVEDNPADAELTMETFEASALPVTFHHVEDGESALAFLGKEGVHADAPSPHLVLLDLNLPRLSGMNVLEEMRARGLMTPVLILSSSDAERDVSASYRLGANSYVRKPNDLRELRDTVARIEQFWLSLAILPT